MSSPTNQCTANKSTVAAIQHTSNQSPPVATQRNADQSPAAAFTRRTSDQPSKSTPPPSVTPLKNTKKQKQSLMIKSKTKRKWLIQQEQHKSEKGQCSARQKTKKKKSNVADEWKLEDK